MLETSKIVFDISKSKKRDSSVAAYFKNLKKLVSIMVSLDFKERFSKDRREACKMIIQTYKEENDVQEKEIKAFETAWVDNAGGIQEVYEKAPRGLF